MSLINDNDNDNDNFVEVINEDGFKIRLSNYDMIDVSNSKLTELPDLSRFKKVRFLNCLYNNLTFLPPLNLNTLIELNCSYNKLTSLPPLNDALKVLVCSHNQLTSLPYLNNNLRELYCDFNQLTSLPPLNDTLIEINCSFNQLTSLPSLNVNLQFLFCHNNQLTSLPALNNNLERLYCYNNKLTYLPPFNDSLEYLFCGENMLKTFPPLNNLRFLHYVNNPINELISTEYENNINFVNDTMRDKLIKWNYFRDFYFLSKYRKKFISWMWKSREAKIRQQFHPNHLISYLEQLNDDLNTEALDKFLELFH